MARSTLEHLLRTARVERAGRLVGQDDLGVVGEGARHRHALALAAGELIGPLVDMVAEPEALEDRSAARARIAPLRRGA
jgi:hypothetical protein